MSEATRDRLDRLETLIEQQQATIEDQQERIADQQETLQAQQDRLADFDAGGDRASGPSTATRQATPLTRRNALKAGGLLALLFGGVGTVSADPQGQVGTSGDPLQMLYTEALNGGLTDEETVTTLAGDGLALTDGALTTALGSGLGVDASDRLHATPTKSDVDTATISLAPGGTAERKSDYTNEWGSMMQGIEIEPQVPTDSIDVRISAETSGESTVYLTDTGVNVLDSTASPGATNYATLSHSLSAGHRYYVVVDADGDNYNCGYGGGGFPHTSPAVHITNGVVNNGHTIGSSAYGVDRVRVSPELSGTRTVEWDAPDSVSRWEVATYRAVPDGETVDVFVETDDGSGWETWDPADDGSPTPIGPGTDLSAIPASSRVRVRVELSRSDESNDPRVTTVTRQWRPGT